MSAHNTILVQPNPRGVRRECIVSGTPKPGTCMTVKAAIEPVNGNWTYEAFNDSADGVQNVVAVLLEDDLQGRTISDAYVDGTKGFLYFPLPGDLLQILIKNQYVGTGTGDFYAIGDKLIIDDGTGMGIKTTGSPEMEPFIVMETDTSIGSSDELLLCMFTGN